MSNHANIAVFVPHLGCPHACAFCNQKSISGQSKAPTANDVAEAIETARKSLERSKKKAQLAFFGGSFTAIDKEYMTELLDAAQPYIKSGFLSGIRCSTRPDCISEEILSLLKNRGVSAIELGAQSMDDKVLALNERGHTAQQVREASKLIKACGLELGLQMMTGLYGDSDDGARYTANELAKLEPATVRIYPTVVLKGTKLAELYEKGEYFPPDTESSIDLCAELLELFEQRGIKVIKLGLHAECSVERDKIAGAYHPAMRELCEARIFLRKMEALLAKSNAKSGTFSVNPKDISKALGQKRENIKTLERMGYKIAVAQDASLECGTLIYSEQE